MSDYISPYVRANAQRLGIISRNADHRRDVFAREQSRALRELEWEGRRPTRESWGQLALNTIGFIALLIVIYYSCLR